MKDYFGVVEGNLECIEDLGPQTGHNRKLKIKCINCGKEFYLRPYQFKKQLHTCPTQYVGMTNGVLTCIEDLGLKKVEDKTIHQLKVVCSRCGKESIVRADRINSTVYIPKSCSNCYNDLMQEIADNKYSETRSFRKRLHSIQGNAKGRNIKLLLTEEQIKNILEQDCYYCGEPNANGIDRIDSKKDYTIDNTVPCCSICNVMKNKFPVNVFLDKVKKIYNRFFIEGSTTIPKGSTLQANGNGKRRNPK